MGLGLALEDRVLGGGAVVEPIEEGVVLGVDEELRATRIGRAGVGHGQGADLVGELGRQLVGDVAAAVTRDGLTVGGLERGEALGAARASARRLRVLG